MNQTIRTSRNQLQLDERCTWLNGVHIALRELAAELRRSDLQECSRMVELAAESVQSTAQSAFQGEQWRQP